jgi:hypothetical protein
LFLFSGKWQHVKETTEVGEGKLFSPGNLRATFDNPDYEKVFILLFPFSIEWRRRRCSANYHYL